MACYHPLAAWRVPGGVNFTPHKGGDRIDLPCGRCIGCRLERSRQWATRIMFEAQFHEKNSFLTLTYDSEHLPNPPSLRYPDVQKFLKRLRKFYDVRYYVCGEYGERNGRPHYHMCLFGEDFSSDRAFCRMSGAHPVFTSPRLSDFWHHGDAYIAELSFDSAAYVARYCLSKVTGDAAGDHYRYVCPDTGEISQLEPEFGRMSLKPGIGGQWFEKYSSDVYGAGDYVVINGRKCKPPRYFDKLLRRKDVLMYDDVKTMREFNAYDSREHNLDDRLAVRERVKIAQLRASTKEKVF